MNPVRKSAEFVVKNAEDVKINREAIEELADKWSKQKLVIPPWPKVMHLQTKDQRKMLDYLIILDSLNFCFWSQKEKWNIEYKGKKYDGYFALSLALKKFFENHPEKADFNYLSKISFNEFKNIVLNGKGDLLFLKKRWEILREVSSYFNKKWKGDSLKFIESAKNKFEILIPKIYKEIPSFNDTAIYKGKKVYLLKRAQVLGADIYSSFNGKGPKKFEDPNYLTMFPDYKIPQILRAFKILEYSPILENKIKNKKIIPAGSEQEIEIRSASVIAVECLKEKLRQKGKNVYSFQLDWLFWTKSQKTKMPEPYHRTKTIFY